MLLLLLRPTYVALFAIVLGIFLTTVNIYQLRSLQHQHYTFFNADRLSEPTNLSKSIAEDDARKPIAWIKGERMESGYLSHVIWVFERLGYKILKGEQQKPSNEIEFDVLWSHEYPFSKNELKPFLSKLKPYQKINHIPGSGFYTSKVNLATTDILEGIPKAFKLPTEKDDFLEYANANADLLWVKKNNEHRGVRIRQIDDLDLNEADSFVQQYIADPLLIDGRKFDIGIYTVITSVMPLRVYVYEGDALLRFCPEDYYPFDSENVNKYVIGDNYTPTWQMPSLKKYYVDEQMTFRETLNAYLRSVGKDADKIWESMKDTIAEVFQSQQTNMLAAGKRFTDKRSFFELSRFDFILDEHLNVFLMESNMSPNLSSGHFIQNQLLYEQVIINVLSLVGIATHLHGQSIQHSFRDKNVRQMEVSDRDLRVYAEECAPQGALCYGKDGCSKQLKCQLCGHCLNYELKSILRSAYEEHLHRRNMRRILPATIHKPKHVAMKYSQLDRLLILWFDAKCHQDRVWCS